MGPKKVGRKRQRRKRNKNRIPVLTEAGVAEASAMTVIRKNPAPSTVATDQLRTTLRYQSAPTVLGLPEGHGIKGENGNDGLTSNIIIGHYFNNPLVTGYVREKHPPRKLLEGYEKLVKRQNHRRSKALRRLKEEGIWTVGAVSDDGLQGSKSEASALIRPPSPVITEATPQPTQASLGPVTPPTASAIDRGPSVARTIIPPVKPVGEADNISHRKYRGIIGYNIGQTLQEVQKMFPPSIQELMEEIVEGHMSVRHVNRKYWYIFFKNEAALQHVLENAPRRWVATEGRNENDPKISTMKDCHPRPGPDPDSGPGDLGLTRQSGGTPSRASQNQRSTSQEKPDRAPQAQPTAPPANTASPKQLAPTVTQTSAETDDSLSDLSRFSCSVVEKEHLDPQYCRSQQALLRNINPGPNNFQDSRVYDEIPPSAIRVIAKSQHFSSTPNHSSQTSKPAPPASYTAAAQPVPEPQAPARPPPASSASATSHQLPVRPPPVSVVPSTLHLRISTTENTPIFSGNPFVNAAPPINRCSPRTQDRPGRGASCARTTVTTPIASIISTVASTPMKQTQVQATPARPNSIFINAPPGSSSRLDEAMSRPWPQPNINITKEPKPVAKATAAQPSQSRERTRPGTPVTVSIIGKADTPAIIFAATRVVTPITKSTAVEAVNPKSITPEPIIPKPIIPGPATPELADTIMHPRTTTATTRATAETQTPIIVTTTPEVPHIICTTATPPDLLDLGEDSLPVSFYGESTFVLPPLVASGSGSTIGDWRTDLAGLEWISEEVAEKGIMDEEEPKIQDSGVDTVLRAIEGFRMGAGGKENMDSRVEVIVGRPKAQGNKEIAGEDSEETVDVATLATTDTGVKKKVDGETMALPLGCEIVIKQEPKTENIDISTIPIYESITAGTPDIKTEVPETSASTNPGNDEEWEDEDKAKEVVKKRTRSQRGQKRSSKRKDIGQELVSAHLDFLRRAATEGGLRVLLGELRKLEKD